MSTAELTENHPGQALTWASLVYDFGPQDMGEGARLSTLISQGAQPSPLEVVVKGAEPP